MSFPVEIILKKEKQEGVLASSISGIPSLPKAVA